MQLVLNELSIAGNSIEVHKGIKVFEQFINTYSEAIKKENGFDRAILTTVDLNTINIAENYNVSKWRNNDADRDVLRRFVNMCDRQNVVLLCQDESELACERGVGIGLLTAYENVANCISFVYDSFWEDYVIQCKYYSLSENKEYAVIISNLSKPDHLKENYKQIQELKKKQLTNIRTPLQLLANIDSLFPSLIFHDNALRQIKNEVQVHHVGAICDKLMMLENYFSHWDGAIFDETAFPTKCISPQSKETLERFEKQHTYSFQEKQIIVSYHIRYTGNIPGRIYFHPANTIRKAYVCSLTTKLPSVSNPKQKV